MKRIFVAFALLLSLSAFASPAPTSEVNERVLKAFNETFIDATEVSWVENRDTYQAIFKMGDIQVRALYKDDGTLTKTIRYYQENLLPANIKAKLKKKHADKTVYGVTETTEDDVISYEVNLKNDTHWYVIKSDSHGNLEQVSKFKRGDL